MKSPLRRDRPGVPSQRLRHRRRQPVVSQEKNAVQRHPCFGSVDAFPVSNTYGNVR